MVRAELYKDINEVIKKNSMFDQNDFNMQASNQSQGSKLKISYIYDTQFYFEAFIPNKRTDLKDNYTSPEYSIKINLCPGELAFEESNTIWGKMNLLNEISNWTNFLKDELLSIPINRIADNNRKAIEEMEKKLEEMEDGYFSNEEAEEIKEKLSVLEEKMQENYKSHIKDNKKLEDEMKSLHREIETLRNTVYSLRKIGWYKSLVVRIYNWTSKSENRKLLITGAKLLKPLLPESINDLIQEDNIVV